MSPEFLLNGDVPGRPTLLFAHGAGAPMDTPWMTSLAERLAGRELRVARFEFTYMAERRKGGPKRPPPRMDVLCQEYLNAVETITREGPLFIAGKSMGGRVASLIADELYMARKIDGLLCLGYPFHPRGKPEKLRTEHLETLATPTLICQGTRDPLGSEEDVAQYALSELIQLHWLPDGDHDLKPRKRQTGLTLEDHLMTTSNVIGDWVSSHSLT